MPERFILEINLNTDLNTDLNTNLNIREIFWSFQGEGRRMGVPAIFLRLAGCTAQCPDCDTKDSWLAGLEGSRTMTVDDILNKIHGYRDTYPQAQVVITGGEPLEQDLTGLTAALKRANYFLSIETNGLWFQDLSLDWWTISPKYVTGYVIHPDLVQKIDEIKLVVNQHLDLEQIKRIRAQVPGVPIFLQPGGSREDRYHESFLLYRHCQAEGLDNIRAGVQLHKVYHVE